MSEASPIVPRPSKQIWRTPVGRSDFAFRSMLFSDDAPFFRSLDHFRGLVEQRTRTAARAAVFFFIAIALAFAILLRSGDIAIDISTPIGQIAHFPISNNILLFALSVATAYYVIMLINHLLINKQLSAIFEHSGLDVSEAMSRANHASARWSADELWVDVLNFRPQVSGPAWRTRSLSLCPSFSCLR